MTAFALISLGVVAQIPKGTTMVGGTLGFITGKENSQFNLDPNVGFFVANNFALGGFLSYSQRNLGDTRITDFGFGPFARYYFGTTSTKPFFVTEFDFLTAKTRTGEVRTSTNGYGFLIGLGFAAFINDVVAIEGITGYNYSNYKNSEGSGGFAMRFGFQIYLNKNSINDLKTNVTGKKE